MPVKYDPPSKEVVEKYYRELGVTDQTIKRDVAVLQSWMEKQPHLPHNVDAATLKRFLILCKNSMERAKSKLDCYYTARSNEPDLLLNRDPLDPYIKNNSEVAMYCLSPKPTPEGDRVIVVKCFNTDVKLYDLMANLKIGLMVTDAHLADDHCRKHVVIFDAEGISIGHAACFTIPFIKKALSLFLGVFPLRFLAFHVINTPTYFDPILTIIKGFMPSKLAKRLHNHSKNLSSLHQHVPRDVLPPECGGTLPLSLEQLREMSYKYLVERRDWFLEQNKIHSDENKRPDRKLNGMDSALEGSFRKMTID